MANETTKTYLDADTFAYWRNLANHLQFDCNYFNLVNYNQAAYICNGIGAYWMPEKLRKAINALCEDLQPVAGCHDIGFSIGEETREAFTAINKAFRVNGFKMAKYKHPWYSWKRYRTMRQALAFSRLCQTDIGWKTYVNGIRKYKAQMEAEKLAETSM